MAILAAGGEGGAYLPLPPPRLHPTSLRFLVLHFPPKLGPAVTSDPGTAHSPARFPLSSWDPLEGEAPRLRETGCAV